MGDLWVWLRGQSVRNAAWNDLRGSEKVDVMDEWTSES